MLDQRSRLLRAALGFVTLRAAPRRPALSVLHGWLDSWRGIGDVVVSMHRQGLRRPTHAVRRARLARFLLHERYGAQRHERERRRSRRRRGGRYSAPRGRRCGAVTDRQFSFEDTKPVITDRALLDDLRAIATRLGIASLPQRVYRPHGRYSTTAIKRRFGSWNAATTAAGLTAASHRNFDEAALLDNLREKSGSPWDANRVSGTWKNHSRR